MVTEMLPCSWGAFEEGNVGATRNSLISRGGKMGADISNQYDVLVVLRIVVKAQIQESVFHVPSKIALFAIGTGKKSQPAKVIVVVN